MTSYVGNCRELTSVDDPLHAHHHQINMLPCIVFGLQTAAEVLQVLLERRIAHLGLVFQLGVN
jgi:hypothetical protein